MKYSRVANIVFREPWAIRPDVYAVICELVAMRISGERLSQEEIQAPLGAAPARPAPRSGGGAVAVLPLYGIMAQRMNLMTQMSGGTSTDMYRAAIRQAVNDPNVDSIVMDIDSPGGAVYGVQELYDEIFAARKEKPIVAVANSEAGSAAYYVASAAQEIVVTPGGQVGSIGVIAAHTDLSRAEEMAGVKTTLITAGKYKGEGNPYEPLGDEARAAAQEKVDRYYGMFVNAVAKGRGVSPAEVRGGFGEGRMVVARDAVRMGMADRIGTLDETIARMLAGQSRATVRSEDGDAFDVTAWSESVRSGEFIELEVDDAPPREAVEVTSEGDLLRRRKRVYLR